MTNITTSEHIHNLIKKIVEKEKKSIPLLHLYMMAYFPGSSVKGDGVKLVLPKPAKNILAV